MIYGIIWIFLFDMINHVPSLTLRDLFLIVPLYDTNLSIGGNS